MLEDVLIAVYLAILGVVGTAILIAVARSRSRRVPTGATRLPAGPAVETRAPEPSSAIASRTPGTADIAEVNPALIERLCAGDEVVILREGQPVARLTPMPPP